MHSPSFFMRDQVKHRVDSFMRTARADLPGGDLGGRDLGGPMIVALVVVLTILNLLAVAPSV